MNYLVCVRIDDSDKLRYLVPVVADTDIEAGTKAVEQLQKWQADGYKYVEVSVVMEEDKK